MNLIDVDSGVSVRGRNARVGIATHFALCLGVLAILSAFALPQQSNSGSLRGQVTDPTGAVVVGAAVSVATVDGRTLKALSDKEGVYVFHGILQGNVTLSVSAAGFAAYEMPNVIIRAGETQQFDIALGIAVQQQQVTVESEAPGPVLDVTPENNASTMVLKGEDLEALPDDPDELQQDLLALAGPSVGPNGGQIYIDGFANGTLPPKSAIREIRINQNPFSAEYDKPGYSRIEVFTKPGSQQWHGLASFNENNSLFNSRNPFVLGDIPSYHSEFYNGYVSGSLSKKLSFFVNGEFRDITELGAVAAIPSILPAGAAVPSPRRRLNLSTRFDYQLTSSNTLTALYMYQNNHQENLGIGGIALPSQGYSSLDNENMVQLSDTQILSPHLINETRFQFIRDATDQNSNQSSAALNVVGEFLGGGNTIGQSSQTVHRYELQNSTSWAAGTHFVKFGGRLRVVQDSELALANENGTITYSSLCNSPGGAPCPAGTPPCTNPATVTPCVITPLQAFLDGTASQVSILNVLSSARVMVSYADIGAYAQDDWKLRPNLTLSYGLRLESQSGIHDKADLAPRITLSWGLGGGKSAPKTVLRFGYGIFYDRFREDLLLQAERLNGELEQQTVYQPQAGTSISCSPGTIPPGSISASSCDTGAASVSSSPTIYQINPKLRAPYTMQSAVSVERKLGSLGTLSVTYLNSRGFHQLITQNVNAPTVPFVDTSRPLFSQFGTENIYQYNSDAFFHQNQLITNFKILVSKKFSLTGFYALGWVNSNTGEANSFPSNQYNLRQDYGRASYDVRHRLLLSGSALLAYNVRISPFVVINSGSPFNIITGQDLNSDSFFNDRPGLITPGCPANDPVATSYGTFDRSPSACERLIPINEGKGFANMTVNMRLSKTFGFGEPIMQPNADAYQGEGGGGGRHGGGHGRPQANVVGPLLGGILEPPTTTRHYNLTFTVTTRNLFNRVNQGLPIGSLADLSRFGHTTSLAGGPFSSGTANRRVDFQMLFTF